ncbi:hypothetical protein A8H32_22280 [Burkholderia thailandensis]|nr:hypothetical protein A8H32_22280 [Burkholderia thailandensis]
MARLQFVRNRSGNGRRRARRAKRRTASNNPDYGRGARRPHPWNPCPNRRRGAPCPGGRARRSTPQRPRPPRPSIGARKTRRVTASTSADRA